MQIEIVTIGNEVLSGRTLDTNFAFLARALEEASVQVGWHSTVGDAAERIGEALRRALERADAVVATGGLGPTPDDLTRKAVATRGCSSTSASGRASWVASCRRRSSRRP
jgi:nicotinamide-nucleotide amidase